jgi:hypothetical protein
MENKCGVSRGLGLIELSTVQSQVVFGMSKSKICPNEINGPEEPQKEWF